MSTRPKVYIAGMGMITSIGGSAFTTAAAVRARCKGLRQSVIPNREFELKKMALVPDDALPPLNRELDKVDLSARELLMLRLITPAIAEALATVPLKEPPPLFLAMPETLPGSPAAVQANFLDHLQAQTNARIDRPMSRLIANGRAGGLHAVDLAFKYFSSTNKDVALIGGVDTYFANYLLGKLDYEGRVLAAGVLDGFVPGEAAGFLLLVSERVADKLPNKPLARVYQPGLATESGHRYSKDPYRGDGLADAFRLAIENSPGQSINTIYSSMNGEHLAAKEFGVAMIRNSTSVDEKVKHEHPADGFGDIGAAFAPVLMGIAALDLQKGWRQGPALVYAASEQQTRAAIVVQAA